jgi:L-rhamnose mutarotase
MQYTLKSAAVFIILLVTGSYSCKGDDRQSGSQIAQTDTATEATKSTSTANEDQLIIEVVERPGARVDTALLMNACKQNGMVEPGLYQWKNHFVVFGRSNHQEQLNNNIRSAFSNADVKIYDDPFYVFSRENCPDPHTAKKWDHIILTANLVKDTTLQQEYMAYHATQFQKWPEVSNGFCNADFQQLLLFRNGRQLMLVISIPEGESLDQLNPKTTENNPRVDDWNALMKKYQEGIEGTKPGEVWVFLEPNGIKQ